MTRKILLILAIALTYSLNAQTDEAAGAPPIFASTTYVCENEVIDDLAGFTQSAEFDVCPDPAYDSWADSWYTFTPTETRIYAFEIESLTGSVFDVRIGVYSGSPGSLTSMTGCSTRYFSGDLTMGETYYINARGATQSTMYRLCIYPFPETPSNDEPANADNLLESTFEVCENAALGYTTSANHTSEVICATSNPDVWYTFTPTETGEYTFRADLENGSMPLFIGLYFGTPGFLNPIAEGPTSPTLQCSDIVLADLTAGTTYYVSVTSPNSSRAIYFNLCAYKSPDAPINDDCSSPINLTVGTTFEENEILATNTSASVNSDNSNFPICGAVDDFGIYGRDVWFTVTVPNTGSFIIETRAEPSEDHVTDTVIETYTGSCVSDSVTNTDAFIPYYYNLPPPNNATSYCNDQYVIGGNQYAGILFENKTPGEQVFVRVWTWAYQFGKFKISAYDPDLLSTEEFNTNEFKFYPNPTNDVLNINYNQNINNVTVNNIIGKTILTQETDAKSVALDLSSFATGIYIVTVKSGNNTTNFKVVKK